MKNDLSLNKEKEHEELSINESDLFFLLNANNMDNILREEDEIINRLTDEEWYLFIQPNET